jgi:hypothetical protein
MRLNFTNKSNGNILIMLVITFPFLVLMVAAYLSLSTSSYNLARQDQLHTQAQLSADAAVDYGVSQLNANTAWTGTSSDVVVQNDGYSKSTFTVSVTTNSPSSKTLVVTGKSYWPVNSASPRSTVKLSADMRPVESGNYSIISGEGGLIMNNAAKIVGGDVFIDGTVSLANTAQIGLSTNAVNVTVAHQACPVPADATYPRVCNSGENGQPISIQNQAHIYGDVKANNQTSGAGMTNPGLTASSGVSPQPLPTYDRDAQKAAVATTITGAAASCNGTQTRTWAANTKITGDVSISTKCKVTVQGNVWITGNLSMANTSQMIVADSLGATRPVVMIDGSIGATFSNSSALISNSVKTGFEIITFWSAAGCSPNCSTVTGTSLYNSRNITTISLSNSAEGAQTIFYAYWSEVMINNSGQIGALIGQTVSLANTGTITFGTSTQTGGTSFWVLNGYIHIYN